jgi:DNA-binding transcriptional LysR family regulator
MAHHELHLIQSFLKFAKSQNIVEAAEALKISQPALSAHLKLFASKFQQDVFVMIGRRKELTEFGKSLYVHLSNRFAGIEDEIRQIELQHQSVSQAHLRVGGRLEVLSYFIQNNGFPGRVECKIMDGALTLKSLRAREIDLAISQHLDHVDDLVQRKAFSDEFVIVLSKRIAKNFSECSWDKRWQILKENDLISFRDPHPYLAELCFALKRDLISNPKVTISNWNTIVEYLRHNKCWSIVPKIYVNNYSDLASFSMNEIIDTQIQFYFLYRRDLRKITWFKDFIEKARFKK